MMSFSGHRQLVSCPVNSFTQAGAILRLQQGSAKGAVLIGTALGRERRWDTKAPCSLGMRRH